MNLNKYKILFTPGSRIKSNNGIYLHIVREVLLRTQAQEKYEVSFHCEDSEYVVIYEPSELDSENIWGFGGWDILSDSLIPEVIYNSPLYKALL